MSNLPKMRNAGILDGRVCLKRRVFKNATGRCKFNIGYANVYYVVSKVAIFF